MDLNNKVLSVFKSFTNDIIKVFPEYEESLQETYSSIIECESIVIEESELLKEFLDRVNKHNKKITNKDEELFKDDPLLLTGISFKDIWNDKITHKTKETIWKYLQTFCLLTINLQSNKDLQAALSELSEDNQAEIKDKKIASDVKKIKKMSENIKEPIAEDLPSVNNLPSNTTLPSQDNPFSQIDQMMGNSEIGKIAQQVSESINIEEMLGGEDANPMDMIQKMMSGDMMGQIMSNIHNVVTEKVDSGELNKDDMVKEAQGIYGNLGDNPLFQGMNQQTQQNRVNPNNPHQSNKTRARLQKKLQQKKEANQSSNTD